MKTLKIYISDPAYEYLSIEKALAIMTDDWIDEGNYAAQTVIDLRDALIYYKEKYENQSRKTD